MFNKAKAAVLGALLFGIVLKPGSRLWVEGDSTLHAFMLKAEELILEADLSAQAATRQDILRAGGVKGASLSVPVAALKSDNKKLDDRAFGALKGKEFPRIVFRMDAYQAKPEADADFPLSISGRLEISGHENPVTLTARGKLGPEGIVVKGEQALVMSQYGVKPPRFAGLLSVKEKVVVHYDLTLDVSEQNDTKRRTP